jgi:hypothetical protein
LHYRAPCDIHCAQRNKRDCYGVPLWGCHGRHFSEYHSDFLFGREWAAARLSAFDWASAKQTFAAGDYQKTIDNLDRLSSGNNSTPPKPGRGCW